MTSDHNSSELEIHDHSNELSRSKLVPKVVPPADKTDTSRQELELLFHHHITMLRVILFSIHNDEWKSFQCHHQTALRIHKDGDGDALFQLEIKDKDFCTNSDIQDNSSEIKLRGRLLASFQDDAKYEHVGQDTRSQGGKDDQDEDQDTILNDKSNLIDLMKECHNELTSGEIVSLKILSRTMEVRS
ncbi:hypothetical protein Tco_1295098 [Tanacetum coccineum]